MPQSYPLSMQAHLRAAAERLGAARSLTEVVEALRSTARSAIGADGIAVVLRDGEQCFYVAEDAVGPLWAGSRFSLDRCVSGWAMRNSRTVVIPDIRDDPRVPQAAYSPTFVRSLVMVPIGHPEPVAALGAYWSNVGDHALETIERLETLAQLAAAGIENAQLIHRLEENERLRSLMLEAGRMGTWTYHAATTRLEASDICRRNFGRDPDQPFTYADLLEAIVPEDRDRMRAAVDRSLASGSNYEIEYRIVIPSGEQRWIEARGQPARLIDGEVNGLVGVTIDVTERKRMEVALRTSAATLDHLVQERTAELVRTQDALKQSQKLEAMGSLTGGVAHDFNNLLTPIIGSLDLLHRRGVGGEREQRLIAGAMQSADRARVLVQRLLAFARRQPLKPELIDVSALVLGMGELIGTTMGPQIQLVFDVAADLPPAIADPHQVEMALLNLAVNAHDAMPSGGKLTLSARTAAAEETRPADLGPGDYVILCVTDTGCGMDDETRRRAIEPFFSTKGLGRGTGLGLSMAHGLASQSGGALTVDSDVGKGTAIALWLPVSDAVQIVQTVAPSVARPIAGIAILVDDEDLVRESTADMLAEMGLHVLQARNADEALVLLGQNERVDILITDYLMPGMTGVELARTATRMRPLLASLIISGYSDTVGLEADIPRLQKPFRHDELALALGQLITTMERGHFPGPA